MNCVRALRRRAIRAGKRSRICARNSSTDGGTDPESKAEETRFRDINDPAAALKRSDLEKSPPSRARMGHLTRKFHAESKTETFPETQFHPPRARCVVEALAFGVSE